MHPNDSVVDFLHFFFDLNGHFEPDQNLRAMNYLTNFRLTARGHLYSGFDEMREWLIEKGYPYEIDGVEASKSVTLSRTIGVSLPRTLDCYIASQSCNAVLVKVAEPIAVHFKLRWG